MKKMKRIIICVTAIMLMLSFVACKNSKNSELTGSWTGSNGGYEIAFTFNEDGTGVMSISGIQLNISYSVDGEKLPCFTKRQSTAVLKRPFNRGFCA